MAASNEEVDALELLAESIHAAAEREESTFHVTHNYIIRSFPTDIKVLKPWLQVLHIDNCFELAELPPAIGDLSNLRWLNVAYNKLTQLPPELGKLRRLERLHCNNNNITSLPIELWSMKALEEIRCDSNRILALPTGVLFLPALRDLQLENNPLLAQSDVDGAEAAELFPPLRYGDCSNCSIRFTRSSCFVTFHTVCRSPSVPIVHYVDSEKCEEQLRGRLVAYDESPAAAAESPAASPQK